MWAGEQVSAALAPSLGAILLLTPPSLSPSACEPPNLTPFLDGSSVGSADVSVEQNKNTCSLLGMGEGKTDSKKPSSLKLIHQRAPGFHSSVPPATLGACLDRGWLCSSLEEARRCHSQDKVSPVPGSQQREAAAHNLQPWAAPASVSLKPPNKTPARVKIHFSCC